MKRLLGKRVYLDTNVFVYAMEAFEQYVEIVGEVFQAVDSGRTTAVTSFLTLGECLVKPFRDKRSDMAEGYVSMIQEAANFEVADIDREVMVSAARLRAQRQGLRMPDAIHLATARQRGCDAFLTNDRRLAAADSPKLPIILLDALIL